MLNYIYIYIYPNLLEEVDMKKINLKKSVKSKRIWNFSSQEVNMAKKKKKVHDFKLEKI